MTRQAYSAEERAEAVGLAMSVGDHEAARRLGIPRRTISEWRHQPGMQPVVSASREQVAERLWEAVVVGTEEVLRGLRDPKARLSDKARALEVVAREHALLTGRATSHALVAQWRAGSADDLTSDEQAALRDALRAELARRAGQSEASAATDEQLDEFGTRILAESAQAYLARSAAPDAAAIARRIAGMTDAELERDAPQLIAELEAALRNRDQPEWMRDP
ncbi:MAG: hypothetical protein M3N29_09925 [Chloroflexota bacterium]|nr:hypothetical protein [Chloroflexota bacterium]